MDELQLQILENLVELTEAKRNAIDVELRQRLEVLEAFRRGLRDALAREDA